MKKLLIGVAVVFVLFWIISAPTNAGGTVNDGLTDMRGAGDSLIAFLHQII